MSALVNPTPDTYRLITTQKHWTHYLFIAYLLLLAWIPLPVASKPLWAVAFLNSLLCLLCLATLAGCILKQHTMPVTLQRAALPIGAFAVYCCWLILQQWASWSINPFRSQQQILSSISYLQLFLLTLFLVDTRERLRLLLYVLVAGGVFQALYGGLMALSGVEKIWWLEKTAHRGVATGTFTNRNQLANFLVMCLAAGCGLLIAGQQNKPVGNWRQLLRNTVEWLLSGAGWLRLLLAAIVIGIVLTHSRMGNASLFASLTCTGLLWLWFTRTSRKRALVLVSSLLLVDTLIVGTWFGLDQVIERLQNTRVENTEKWIHADNPDAPGNVQPQATTTPSPAVTPVARQGLADNELRDTALPDLLRMASQHALTGIGIGNFSTGFTTYNTLKLQEFYNEAHFDGLQFLIETGIPGTLLLAFIVMYCALRGLQALMYSHSRLLQGTGFAVTMSVGASLMHSWVEYNLQVPATASVFVVMLALGVIASTLPDKKPQPGQKTSS